MATGLAWGFLFLLARSGAYAIRKVRGLVAGFGRVCRLRGFCMGLSYRGRIFALLLLLLCCVAGGEGFGRFCGGLLVTSLV